jgi:hypothetical protein
VHLLGYSQAISWLLELAVSLFSRVFGIVIALLVFSRAGGATFPENTTKGFFLYHACQDALIDHPNDEQVRLGDICFSYIEGFIDGEGPVIKYKFFMGVSYQEMASTYVHYMQANKDYLNMSKRMGLEAALKMKYWYGTKR